MTEPSTQYVSNPCPDCGQWAAYNPCEHCGHAFGVGRVFGDLEAEQELALLRLQKVSLESQLAEATQMLHLQGGLIKSQAEEIDKLRAALEYVEFDSEMNCPWCWEVSRHLPDCRRQIALGLEVSK